MIVCICSNTSCKEVEEISKQVSTVEDLLQKSQVAKQCKTCLEEVSLIFNKVHNIENKG